MFPPLRHWASAPLTDSWGLALEIATLLAGLAALDRGRQRIGAWVVVMLALSFTRDATLVPLSGVAWVALVTRTRRSALLLAAGLAASSLAPIVFGAGLLQELAYTINGYHVPTIVSWPYVLAHYPAAVWSTLRGDATYPDHLGSHYILWYGIGAALIVAVGYMLAAAPRRETFFMLGRGALCGAAATIALAPNYTGFRLELAFIPCIAMALAFATQRIRTSVPVTMTRRMLREHIRAQAPRS